MSQQRIEYFLCIFLLLFNLSQTLLNIFEDGIIKGISTNNQLFAIASDKNIIFGNITSDLVFTEISRSKINLNNDVLEFKFFDKDSVVICDKNGCKYCVLYKLDCNVIASFLIQSVTLQKLDRLLFLRVAHNKTIAGIYSFKLEHGIFRELGKVIDQATVEHEFKAIYGFSFQKHIYFISQVKRRDIGVAVLSNLTETNNIPINNDIVITQICKNDESKDILSRTDLVLACKCTKNDSSNCINTFDENYEKKVTTAGYLSQQENLFLGIEKSSNFSFMCKFDMKNIKLQFQHIWNYCQSPTTPFKNCNLIKSFRELFTNGCFKISSKNYKISSRFPKCDIFGSVINNSCEASSLMDRRNGWLEDRNPHFGDFVKTDTNEYIHSIYPHPNRNLLYVLQNKSLIKMTVKDTSFQSTSILTNFDLYSDKINNLLTSWEFLDGILYVDPIKKNTIYFKDLKCNENSCQETLVTENLRCGLCVLDRQSSCKPENLQIFCAPFWIKTRHFINTVDEKGGQQKTIFVKYNNNSDAKNYKKTRHRIVCFHSGKKSYKMCSETLEEYLKPILIKHKALKSGNKNFVTSVTPAIYYENYTLKEIKDNFDDSTIAKFWPVASGGGILVLLAIILTCIILHCRRRHNFPIQNIPKNRTIQHRISKNGTVTALPYERIITHENMIEEENISFLERLGKGNSAYVRLANYTFGSTVEKVAVKKLKNYNEAEITKEMICLSSCSHNNIVKFIGWMNIDEKICMITEFMEGGDLHTYLKDPSKPLTLSIIFSYIFQVLDGMIYLGQKHILHRDLAARNCLLDKFYKILKITDFGASREMNENYEYISENGCELPLRWLPPEALFENNYTVKGDVWSFAVLIWEMFERGTVPYSNLTGEGVKSFIFAKGRLSRPEHCPLKLYNVMRSCWKKDAEQRPNFESIKRDIKIIFNKITVKNLKNC